MVSVDTAITGNIDAYTDVLDDCFTAFHRNPQLYILQTEFGRKQPNLSHYCSSLRNAVANISTQSVPSILWLEDAHLIAYAMLYDTAVFVYNGASSRWVVYNDTGSRGYICLYFTGSHFDLMRGVDGGRPSAPPSAEGYDYMSWHAVQLNKPYAFPGVWRWPAHQSVNVSQDSPSRAQARLYTYADVIRSCSPETTHAADKRPATPTRAQCTPPKTPVTENSRAVHEEDESSVNVHKCTVCFREFNSLRGMRAHCTKTHMFKPCSSRTTDQHSSDSQGNETAEDSVRCSACANVFASLGEVRLHQFQCHEVSSMDDVRRLETDTQDTVTVKRGDGECSDAAEHVCTMCSKSFGSKAALSMHLMRVHHKRKLPVISDISESKEAKLTEMPNEQSSGQTDAVEKNADTVKGKLCEYCGNFFVNLAKHKKVL